MIKAAIIGASGYTGAELIRILSGHPNVEIIALVADSNAGKEPSEIYPHLAPLGLPTMVTLSEVDMAALDVVFCCLPHATSQEVIKALPDTLKVIDLSADFRIEDGALYEEWYGTPHAALELQKQAVYGLTEHYREQVKATRLVACPGCYPTSMLLPLLPLLQKGFIKTDGIIVDSKSGISGAGRSAKTANLFAEMEGNVRPYGLGGHRHVAEVEQELRKAAGVDLMITFTPQVVPMNRGILSCIYVTPEQGKTADDLRKCLQESYVDEAFVHISTGAHVPATRDVYSTNHAMIGVYADRVPNRVIIISAIDNLIKGASGQAVQNMNVMFGLPEVTGVPTAAVFP